MRKLIIRLTLAGLAGGLACAVSPFGVHGCAPSARSDEGSSHYVRVAPPGYEKLAHIGSWAFAIGDGALDGSLTDVVDRLAIFDLVVIDGEEATAEQISALRRGGTCVLAYLSVGTIEPWRPWYERLAPFALDAWSDWDEYYADVAEPGYRDEILIIADSVLDKGFDGLFLDNLDMVESHADRTEGMRQLVLDLSALVHRRHCLLFAQNADAFVLTSAPLIDGWNREDVTFTYDFDTNAYVRVAAAEHGEALLALDSMRRAGALTLTTDYVATGGSAEEDEAVRVAAGVGALPYVSDIDLERIPTGPFSRSAP